MSQTYYVLLECLAQDHMSFLSTLGPQVFLYILSSISEGLTALGGQLNHYTGLYGSGTQLYTKLCHLAITTTIGFSKCEVAFRTKLSNQRHHGSTTFLVVLVYNYNRVKLEVPLQYLTLVSCNIYYVT